MEIFPKWVEFSQVSRRTGPITWQQRDLGWNCNI